MKGPQKHYCDQDSCLYQGTVRFKSMAKTGDLIEQSFPLEFDLRNRGELIVKISNYRMSTILSARNSVCNGCEEVNYYWKIGNDRFKYGPLVELFNPSRNTPYKVVMEFTKGGKKQRVVCEGSL